MADDWEREVREAMSTAIEEIGPPDEDDLTQAPLAVATGIAMTATTAGLIALGRVLLRERGVPEGWQARQWTGPKGCEVDLELDGNYLAYLDGKCIRVCATLADAAAAVAAARRSA